MRSALNHQHSRPTRNTLRVHALWCCLMIAAWLVNPTASANEDLPGEDPAAWLVEAGEQARRVTGVGEDLTTALQTKGQLLTTIAALQAQLGEVEAAEKNERVVGLCIRALSHDGEAGWVHAARAWAAAEAGDAEEAQRRLEAIDHPGERAYAEELLNESSADRPADLEGISPGFAKQLNRVAAYRWARQQAASAASTQPIEEVQARVDLLSDPAERAWAALGVAEGLQKKPSDTAAEASAATPTPEPESVSPTPPPPLPAPSAQPDAAPAVIDAEDEVTRAAPEAVVPPVVVEGINPDETPAVSESVEAVELEESSAPVMAVEQSPVVGVAAAPQATPTPEVSEVPAGPEVVENAEASQAVEVEESIIVSEAEIETVTVAEAMPVHEVSAAPEASEEPEALPAPETEATGEAEATPGSAEVAVDESTTAETNPLLVADERPEPNEPAEPSAVDSTPRAEPTAPEGVDAPEVIAAAPAPDAIEAAEVPTAPETIAPAVIVPNLKALADPAVVLTDAPAPDEVDVRFVTTAGAFTIRVHRDWAPLAADRFVDLARAGYYHNQRFFRVVPGFVVQWGIHGYPAVAAAWRDQTLPDEPRTRANARGTVALAAAAQPDSRTTQVFINLVDNGFLDDLGFVPFGEVVEGLPIVESLFGDYGETPSQQQRKIHLQGNAFLDENYPELDSVISVEVR